MAGLLGDDWVDSRTLATLGLAAGLLGGRTLGDGASRGLLAYQQSLGDSQDRQTKGLLTAAQIQSYQANAALDAQRIRQAQQQIDQRNAFLGIPSSSVGGAGVVGGSSTPAVGGAGVAPASSAGIDAFTAEQISKKFGIPKEAIIADYLNNGGKKIAELIEGRAKPDWTTANGYVFNKNAVSGPGYLPSLATSNDGKTTQVTIGADGQPIVSAPRGSAETFANFENIRNQSGAAFTPGRPVLDAAGRQRGQSQLQEVGGAPTPVIGMPAAGNYRNEAGMRGQMGGIGGSTAALDREIAALQADIAKVPDANSKAMLVEERDRLIAQKQKYFGGAAPAPAADSPAGALDFSPAEKASQDAARTRAVNTASADVVRDTGDMAKGKSANQMIAAANRGLELLDQGPTASGIGQSVDKAAQYFGRSTKGAQVASQLDIVAGELLNNVPRMEGPQSDGDRIQYKEQAGRAANRDIPTPERKAALQEILRLQGKYSSLNGGGATTQQGGAQGSWNAPGAAKSGWSIQLVK